MILIIAIFHKQFYSTLFIYLHTVKSIHVWNVRRVCVYVELLIGL